jgi:cellulose biosynthesis protein BcsQ
MASSSSFARCVYLGSEGADSTSFKLSGDMADYDNQTPFLLIDASENGALTKYLFDYKLEGLDMKKSFDQLLRDLVVNDANISSLDLNNYMIRFNNYTKSFVIPSFGTFHLYREGLYGITTNSFSRPGTMTTKKTLLTSLDGLLNKLGFQGHILIDTHGALDVITQMAIVAARQVKTTSLECIPRIEEWLHGNPKLDPMLYQHEFASICHSLDITLPEIIYPLK